MVSLFLKIEVETDAIDGKLVLAECSRLFHESLRNRIERQLRQAVAVGSSRVEMIRIVLDLGDLSATHWRKELGERLDVRLAAELAILGREVEDAPHKDVILRGPVRRRAGGAVQARRDAPARGASDIVVSRTIASRGGAANTAARKPKPSPHKKPKTEPIFGVGIILLWPFLARLWSIMGYVQNGAFQDSGSRLRATTCLDWLIAGGHSQASCLPGSAGSSAGGVAVSHPTASRLLCGLTLDSAISQSLCTGYLSETLTDAERSQLTTWRDSLPARLPGLDRCGPGDITSLFLQRSGAVSTQNEIVTLHVERDASDILLRSIPWPMQQLVLPWLEKPMNIDWL